MQRISSEHPGYPVRVLSGDLVENPTTTGEMMRNHPTMREFFVRLAKTTGQAVGQDFLRRLEQGQGDLRMFSPDMAVPLAALKKLAPGHELEQMEAFQSAFYGEGRDVLAPEVQMRIANVDGDVFMRALEDPGVQAAAEAGREEALDILGDFVVYPTLFLETDDGERHVLARGYAIIPLWPPSLPPCSAEEPAARRHARQRVRPRRALRYFSMKGKDRGAFQKAPSPNLPQKLRFVEAAQQESVPVKGKASYPMCKPFPAVPPNQKPAQHVRAGFIFVYPKV
ncbi:MAG: hypothetical protein ACLR0N_11875 [Bilophila wadsworthia]